MHAHMPPFTRKDPPARAEPAAPISDREAGLRTLKHYLYHAGLIVDQLIASEMSITARVPESATSERIPVRHLIDWCALDAQREAVVPLRRNADGSLATDGTAADFQRDRDATGA